MNGRHHTVPLIISNICWEPSVLLASEKTKEVQNNTLSTQSSFDIVNETDLL